MTPVDLGVSANFLDARLLSVRRGNALLHPSGQSAGDIDAELGVRVLAPPIGTPGAREALIESRFHSLIDGPQCGSKLLLLAMPLRTVPVALVARDVLTGALVVLPYQLRRSLLYDKRFFSCGDLRLFTAHLPMARPRDAMKVCPIRRHCPRVSGR
jgi:hypothetical protein